MGPSQQQMIPLGRPDEVGYDDLLHPKGRWAMRAPKRWRPRKREIFLRDGSDLPGLANRVEYIGSPEHKAVPSFAGQPRPRADASCCPPEISQSTACEWLRSAIRLGAVGAPWEGDFPRYVWHKEGGLVYEGRLVNRQAGTYKGYPLQREEWPDRIESIYAES